MLHLIGGTSTITESPEIRTLRLDRDAWLSEAGVSPKTEANYRAATDQLLRFLSERAKPFDRIAAKAFRLHLAGKGVKASTQRSVLTAVKSFSKWRLEARGIADAMALVTAPKSERVFTKRALTRSEAKRLASAAEKLTVRDRAIILLAMICGLRTIEISRANRGDIGRIQAFDVLYVQGKGRADKSEFIVLPKEVRLVIEQLLAVSHHQEALFISTSRRNYGQRLDTQTIRKMIKKVLRSIGIDEEGVSAHSLRHTAASLAMESGVEISLIQSSLRHRSIDTTTRYVHMAAIQRRLENNPESVVSDLLL